LIISGALAFFEADGFFVGGVGLNWALLLGLVSGATGYSLQRGFHAEEHGWGCGYGWDGVAGYYGEFLFVNMLNCVV
jgi:hypothetical protein